MSPLRLLGPLRPLGLWSLALDDSKNSTDPRNSKDEFNAYRREKTWR